MANLWVIFSESIHGLGKDPPFPALPLMAFPAEAVFSHPFTTPRPTILAATGNLIFFRCRRLLNFSSPRGNAWTIYG
jgi:hypothetical protein